MEYTENAKTKNGKWQHFVEHCTDLFEKCSRSDYRKDRIDSITEGYRVYKQKERTTGLLWETASKTELPLLTITVDNVEPRVVAGLTGKEPFVEFEMEGLTEQDPIMVILQDWFNSELKSTVNIQDIAARTVHKILLEGTVYPIVSYDEDDVIRRDFVFEDVPRIDPMTGQPAIDPTGKPATEKKLVMGEDGYPVTEDTKQSVFKGGKVEFAEFSDVFVPDEALEWEKTDVIRIVRPTYGELMQNKEKMGYITENIGPHLLSEEKSEKTDEDRSPEQKIDDVVVTGHEIIECLECCISYVYQEENQKKEEVTDWEPTRYVGLITRDSGILIRMLPLIDLNYKNEHLIKRVRLYTDGSSMYDKMKSIQTGATDLFNMVVNVATICMIPWFLYTDAAGFDGKQKIVPGEGIKVDDVTQVSFPKFSQNPRSYMVFIEMFMSLWEKLGSISDIQVGRIQDGSSDVTATETMAALQEGNIKHNYQGLALKRDFIELLKTIYDLYYQKMPYDATFTYQNQQIPVPRHAMRRGYKFKLTGSSDMSNKAVEAQKAEGMYKAMRQDPVANPIPLIKNMVLAFNEDADPKEYINPTINQFLAMLKQNPEIMQVLQQYMQQKQQKAQQGAQAQQLNMAQATGQTMAKSLMEGMNPNA